MATVIRSYPTERSISPMHLNLSVPAWINQRPELSDSYKLFYGAIVNLIGNQSIVAVETTEILKILNCSLRSFFRHKRTSLQHQLIHITSTEPGFYLYRLNTRHPWVPAEQNIASMKSLKVSL